MPYKRPGSSRYQIRRRNLVGVGDTGVLTTQTRNLALARRMEQALEDLAERALVEPSYRAVLEAVIQKRLPLPDLLSAHSQGTVGDLRTALVDPPLADCLARFVERTPDGRERTKRKYAAEMVVGIAPVRARLSWIRNPRQVTALLHAAERGEPADADGTLRPRKRNTVRRYALRAISHVLRTELGQAERNRILQDVQFAGEDDTREVALTGDDVTRLLSACTTLHGQHPRLGFDELGAAVRLMLQTSADRGVVFAGATGNTERPAPGLTVGQIRIYAESDTEAEVYSGEMLLRDRKTKDRTRTVPLTDGLCRVLLPFVVGKAPDAQVFSLSYAQVDHRWRRARALAGLPSLR
ncbi:MAG: hypothetical protein AAF791_11985, partial [Bacteroidota bacterium]